MTTKPVKNKAFNPGTPVLPLKAERMHMTFARKGKHWYLEWRVYEYSDKPVSWRKARDTEVLLIERIVQLQAALDGRVPHKPKPLKLQPYVPAKKITPVQV